MPCSMLVWSTGVFASSSSSSLGRRSKARAIATRCRCPPLRRVPPSPGRGVERGVELEFSESVYVWGICMGFRIFEITGKRFGGLDRGLHTGHTGACRATEASKGHQLVLVGVVLAGRISQVSQTKYTCSSCVVYTLSDIFRLQQRPIDIN